MSQTITEAMVKAARDAFKAKCGITIYLPGEGTLDDFEMERYDALKDALSAALSVPLPEIEGGDKGDAGMECQYSKDVGMPEHRCAVRCQYGRRQADLRIAAAIEACDWSGASIGNKEILKAAVHALRGGV